MSKALRDCLVSDRSMVFLISAVGSVGSDWVEVASHTLVTIAERSSVFYRIFAYVIF